MSIHFELFHIIVSLLSFVGQFICGSAEDLEKPKFVSEPFDIETFEGTTIELPCAGKGNPKPEVS